MPNTVKTQLSISASSAARNPAACGSLQELGLRDGKVIYRSGNTCTLFSTVQWVLVSFVMIVHFFLNESFTP